MKRALDEQIVAEEHTTETAKEAYEQHLMTKGTQARSRYLTIRCIDRFFPEPLPLWALTERKCRSRYEVLTAKYAVATHRNTLAQVKTFVAWCIKRGWMSKNPLKEIEGVGRVNKRKPQLRLGEVRAWYRKATELAADGDCGATAALCALLLGMRAGEIVAVKVRDVDENRSRGDILWIPDAKTAAGRRTLEVPPALAELLAELCRGKRPDDHLFGDHWRDWPRNQVKRICRAAQVPEVTAYAMRGTLATLSIRGGTPARMVADFLGHESEKTTLESYAEHGSAESARRRRGWFLLEGAEGG